MREGQRIAQLGISTLPRETSNTPFIMGETPSTTPISRDVESSSTSFPRGFVHEDVLNDLKKYPIKPSFEGRNYKREEVVIYFFSKELLPFKIQEC